MEEILLVSGLLLAITCLTAMTQFSKHIKLDSAVLVQSKLQRLTHLLDGSGRWLLFIGSILLLPSLFLGFSDILPHKLAAHLIVISSLILLLASLIIIATTIWRIILFFGFNSLLHMFQLAIKNVILTEVTARKIIPNRNWVRLSFLALINVFTVVFAVIFELFRFAV